MLSKDKIPRCKYYGGTSSRTILHRQSHSIPRLGCYGKHHNTYILLPFCILALLAVGYSIVNPSVVSGAYAEEGSVGSVESSGVDVEDDPSTYTNAHEKKEGSDNGESSIETEDSGEDDYGIMPLAPAPSCNPGTPGQYLGQYYGPSNLCIPVGLTETNSSASSTSVSLTINDDGTVNSTANTAPGSTAYISNNVRVQASNVASYTLQISYANGSSSLNGNTTIGGAGGKTGSNLSDNTWGYGWGDTATTDVNLTYNTMPSYGSGKSLSSNSITNDAVDFTKKLVFAAKFGESASSGHYRTSVLLSLAATPKTVAFMPKSGFSTITNMQQMTSSICKNEPIGAYKLLTDTRDSSKYVVAKLADGNCWMAQNLHLVNKTISSSDSDMTSGSFTILSSSISGFSSSDQYQAKAYYDNSLIKGAYYNWYTATAGSGNTSLTSGDAPSSICPKGWKLPPNSGNGSYTNLVNSDSANTAWVSDVAGTGMAGRVFGGAGFVAGGYVGSSSLYSINSVGHYWSRTADASISANYLTLTSINIAPAGGNYRFYGYPIRCVVVSS